MNDRECYEIHYDILVWTNRRIFSDIAIDSILHPALCLHSNRNPATRQIHLDAQSSAINVANTVSPVHEYHFRQAKWYLLTHRWTLAWLAPDEAAPVVGTGTSGCGSKRLWVECRGWRPLRQSLYRQRLSDWQTSPPPRRLSSSCWWMSSSQCSPWNHPGLQQKADISFHRSVILLAYILEFQLLQEDMRYFGSLVGTYKQ